MEEFLFALRLFGILVATTGLWAWLPFVSRDMRIDLVGSVFFVVVGTLVYLIASWIERKRSPISKKAKIYVLKPNDTRFIVKMLDRERRIFLALGFSFLVFVAFMIFAALDGATDGMAHPQLALVL